MTGLRSQRSQQRDRAIEAFTATRGRGSTDNEVAVLVRESRADKLIEISTEEVRRQKGARVSPEQGHTVADLKVRALDMARSQAPPSLESAAPSLRHAERHVFERVSVARDHDLLAEALRHGRGRLVLEEVKGGLRLEEVSGQMLRAGQAVATRESLDRGR
jgi:hypothetical protein